MSHKKRNTTLSAFSKLVMSFDDQRIDQFYRELQLTSEKFKVQCVDRIVGLMIKMERFFKEHQAIEELYFKFNAERDEAEQEFHEWSQMSNQGKRLEDLIQEDHAVNKAFKQLMNLTATNKFLGQEGIDALIEAEKILDTKIAELHSQQMQMNQAHVANTWYFHRRLSKVLKEITKYLPESAEYLSDQDSKRFDAIARKAILTLSDIFYKSVKKTPTGNHYIALEDFANLGVKGLAKALHTDNDRFVHAYTQEILTELYYALVEFYSTFDGQQQELDDAVKAREANAEALQAGMEDLEQAVQAYAKNLDKYSQTPDSIQSYEERGPSQDGPDSMPTPNLRRG